jgi:quinoprotein glucose dehydrogenase
MRRAVTAAFLFGCGGDSLPSDPALRSEWPSYGADPGGSRFSAAAVIDTTNVDQIRPAWEWRTNESAVRGRGNTRNSEPGKFETTPVMLGDTLYLSTPLHNAVALDANTGRQLWRFDPDATEWASGEKLGVGYVHRGVAVWSGSGAEPRRVFLNSRWKLFALDARTGKPIPGFGTNGVLDLSSGLSRPVNRYEFGGTSPPAIFRDIVIVGNSVNDRAIYDGDPPGDVQAFDVRSGRRLWRWSSIPRPGEPGGETWEAGSHERVGHANVWAPMSVDTARGLVYLPVSAASNDWYGGRRKGANLFSESLVCLDARTGRMAWYYQLVHHGLWDYDLPAQPNVITLTVDGRRVDAVAVTAKTGFVYVFDRVTGRPLWPIEERPVLSSDVSGEQVHETQPFPTHPPAFARQGFAESDLVDFTPELRARAREIFSRYRSGPMFTPPSVRGTIVMPGAIGGAAWGGGAFDPVSGLLYVKASNVPALARLTSDTGTGSRRFLLDPASGDPIDEMKLSLGSPRAGDEEVFVPINRPPYGTLTAIDLNAGALRWQVVLGDRPEVRHHASLRSLRLPPLGVPGAPGPLVTAGGLLFLTGGGRVLYAIDARAGSERWSWDLERIGYSNPMTYRTGTGRQFVVIATGSGEDSRLRAFALPGGQRSRR